MTKESREQWLAKRKTYLGGTDASAIIGVNPYKTALDVFLDKTNRAPELEDNEKMFWGRILEDVVAQVFSQRTGLKVRRRGTVKAPNGILGANIDRQIVGDRQRGPGILEVKTADLRNAHRWGEEGSTEIPEEYWTQVQHYLAVTGYTWARLAVLIGGNDFRIYELPRDEELIEALVSAEMKFWDDHIRTDEPPTPENLVDLAKLYPKDHGREIVATSKIIDACRQFNDVKDAMAELTRMKDAAEFEIKKFMEDATILYDVNGEPLATWKTQSTKRLDSKAIRKTLGNKAKQFEIITESRVFRAK